MEDDFDLSELRDIAESGREQPLAGGVHLLIWGLTVSIGLTITWLFVIGVIQFGFAYLIGAWGVLTFIAVILGRFVASGQHDDQYIGNQVAAHVWQLGGAFMGVIGFGLFLTATLFSARFENLGINIGIMYNMMGPIGFGVYALCLSATAVAARAKWLHAFAYISLGFCVATLFLIATYAQLPVSIFGVLITIALPGLISLRYRR